MIKKNFGVTKEAFKTSEKNVHQYTERIVSNDIVKKIDVTESTRLG
ncbi:hypothetical protein [Lactococcus taiwanensis]|nr:hypothetical protein [Lactococcus taiwanensis]